jgi:hypothetical protein
MVSKRTKIIVGVAAAAAALGALIYAAKKMHEKGYDKKAIKTLKSYADRIKKEASKLQNKPIPKRKSKKSAKKKR